MCWVVKHKSGTVLFRTDNIETARDRKRAGWRVEMDYSKLSDFEINKRVAEILYKNKPVIEVHRDVPGRDAVTIFSEVGDEDLVSIACADYCNNPADAWPIVVTSMLCIEQHGYGSNVRVWGYSSTGMNEIYVSHKEILRGLMIVFLMMQESN